MTLPERTPSPEQVEDWLRECLHLDPDGAQVTVSGTCMEPALKEGSRITLRPSNGSHRLGDVVLLRTPRGLRLHRVLLRFRGAIRTKGDQGPFFDPAASEAAVIALCETDESRLTRFLRTGLSLVRLFARPRAFAESAADDSDRAHARVLP